MVYQAADDRWLCFSNGVKSAYFDTEREARNVADKIKFSAQGQAFCTKLAELFRNARDLEEVYFDEGFNDVGSDPDEDRCLNGTRISDRLGPSECGMVCTGSQVSK
jgi:hypothetical protein